MKIFKITASSKARFTAMVKANTKDEAEEKFRKKCVEGEIISENIDFEEIEIRQATSKDAMQQNALPTEIWDRMDRYDYYTKLGYDVAKAEPDKGKYLYSRKGRMIDEYIRRLDAMTADECVKEYYPKNKLLGTDDRNKIREILIQSIIDDAKRYSQNLNAEFNEENLRRNAERAISKMPKIIDAIVAEDRKKMDALVKKYFDAYKKRLKK